MTRFPLILLMGAASLAACTSQNSGNSTPTETTATTITVIATDSECRLSSPATEPGPTTFAVRNDSTEALTFTLYQSDGSTPVGAAADIEAGLTEDMSFTAEPGDYVAACLVSGAKEASTTEFSVSG